MQIRVFIYIWCFLLKYYLICIFLSFRGFLHFEHLNIQLHLKGGSTGKQIHEATWSCWMIACPCCCRCRCSCSRCCCCCCCCPLLNAATSVGTAEAESFSARLSICRCFFVYCNGVRSLYSGLESKLENCCKRHQYQGRTYSDLSQVLWKSRGISASMPAKKLKCTPTL